MSRHDGATTTINTEQFSLKAKETKKCLSSFSDLVEFCMIICIGWPIKLYGWGPIKNLF
jgi:hypothetical protein